MKIRALKMIKKHILIAIFSILAFLFIAPAPPAHAADCAKRVAVDFQYSSIKDKNKKQEATNTIQGVYNNTCRFLEQRAIRKNIKNAELSKYYLANSTNFKSLINDSGFAAYYTSSGWPGKNGYYTPEKSIVINESLGLNKAVISHETIHAFQSGLAIVHGTNLVGEGLTEYIGTLLYGTNRVSYLYPVQVIKALAAAIDRLGKNGNKELVQSLLDNKTPTLINELVDWKKYKPANSGEAQTTWQYLNYNLQIEAGQRKKTPSKNHADLITWLNTINKATPTVQQNALEVTPTRDSKLVTLTVNKIPALATKIVVNSGGKQVYSRANNSEQSVTLSIPAPNTEKQTYSVLALDSSGNVVAKATTSVDPPKTAPAEPPATGTSSNETPTQPQTQPADNKLDSSEPVCPESTVFGGSYCNIGELLAVIIVWAARLGVVGAVLMIIFGGLRIVTSAGSPDAVSQGKEIIIGALLGLVTIFLIGAFLTVFVSGV